MNLSTLRPASVEIMGVRFVLVPEVEYQRLLHPAAEEAPLDPAVLDMEDLVGADDYMAQAIGRTLRLAREAAQLTQTELAKRLRRSQPMVSAAERGTTEVGSRYLAAVLKACGLPPNWKPAARAAQ